MISNKRLFFAAAFILLTIPFSILTSKAAVAITHFEQERGNSPK